MLGESRSRVLEILQDTGAQLGVNDVAARLSLHPNTVRFHLDALVASGLVDSEAEKRDLRGRPRMLYSANANSASAGRRNYRLLAEILASSMAAQTSHPHQRPPSRRVRMGVATSAGVRRRSNEWMPTKRATRRHSQCDGEIGFAPKRSPRAMALVLLHRCPFREVAQEHPEVVCSIHLGLMNGLLAELDAPLEVERLDPFVEPSQCVASPSPAARSRP